MMNLWCRILCWFMDHSGSVRVAKVAERIAIATTPADW